MIHLKEGSLQQFWIKFLILLSSALTMQTALAIPLSSLLNANQAIPSLLVKGSTSQDSPFDSRVINKTSHIKTSNSLAELFQSRIVVHFIDELKLSIDLVDEYRGALVNVWVNAAYICSLQKQCKVFRTIRALKKPYFQNHISAHAEQQNITSQLS